MQGPIAGAFAASFLLLWLMFFAFWLAVVIKLFTNRDAKYVFGLKGKSAPKAIDVTTRAMTEHFSTRIGRLHGVALGILAITTLALGLWALVENKHRNGSAAEIPATTNRAEI